MLPIFSQGGHAGNFTLPRHNAAVLQACKGRTGEIDHSFSAAELERLLTLHPVLGLLKRHRDCDAR